MQDNHERGIAIVLSLFLMSAMSVLAASLMFLAQTETYASMNYRMMSQARYAGEAAVQKASDFLLDNGVGGQYLLPGTVADPLINYDTTKSPVVCTSGCPNSDPNNPNHWVILSATDSQLSNYPFSDVSEAFETAVPGQLEANNATLNFGAYATLIAMQQFDSYAGTPNVVQTWEITGVGELAGVRPATVEVVAIVETPKVPANAHAAFATADTCGAMYFHGNVTINSYDSRVAGGPAASTENSGGDVGTNGNLHIQGSVAVFGNLYTPKVGVGACENGAVTALEEGGRAEVLGVAEDDSDIIQLPTAVTYPLPVFSVTPPYNQTVTIDSAGLASACVDLGLTLNVNCFVDAGAQTLTLGADGLSGAITLPNVSIDGGYTLIIEGNTPGQVININSLTGSGNVEIEANTDAGDSNESVVLEVSGLDTDGVSELEVPFDLSQMSWKQNSPSSNYDASAFQIVYGGSGTISMKGGNSLSGVTIYAPNADFELQGTQDLFGSILARTIENFGNASLHYDRRLGSDFWVTGRPMVTSFTWKRY